MYHYAGNNPIRYIDPDGNAEKKPNALLGQKAHRVFFTVMDIATKAEDPTAIKIFDSRLLNIKDTIGEIFKPNRNPDLDEIPSPNTRPDAVNIKMDSIGNNVEFFELKPISCVAGYKHQKAVAQLQGYISKMKSYFPDVNVEGGNIDSVCNVSIPFPAAGDKATITFIPDATVKGLYYYRIDDGE